LSGKENIMDITYTWENIKVYADRDKYPDDDVICRIDATLVGTAVDGSKVKLNIETGVLYNENRASFILFDDLDLDNVTSFLNSAIAEGGVIEGYKDKITQELSRYRIKEF